ncbi:MAG: ABC transporter permease [bacterium]
MIRRFLCQNLVPIVLAGGGVAFFGYQSPAFLTFGNFVNILIQSSSMAIAAIGMTFVLLTAGIDLSIGSIMFLSAVIAGKMVLSGYALPWVLAAALITGLACGGVNAWLITRMGLIPFIVTLAAQYIGRGLGLWISQTRAMNLPGGLVRVGTARIAGLPVPVLIFLLVLAGAYIVLERTPFGRRIYAAGYDLDVAQKAGIDTRAVLFSVYLICGALAALSGIVSVAQLGAVSPKFGEQREFAAISAAVLGGTSLFGGRGHVFPGTVLGAVLIQTVENGLVIMNADPYLYPLITSAIIFLAVMMDSLRHHRLTQMKRKKIRVESGG